MATKNTKIGSHSHRRVTHHLSKHKTKYSLFGTLSVATVALSLIFFITRGDNPYTSELNFTEYSRSGVGSVIPASCESSPDHTGDPCLPTVNVQFQ